MRVISINKHGSTTRVIACVFFSTNHTWIHQWSLHVCSFHKPHMDQPLESLHVCYSHKPHMDQQLESLHVCSYTKTNMDPPVVIACVFFPQTTHGSTRVIACVFFPQTTHGSTTRVIACLFLYENL